MARPSTPILTAELIVRAALDLVDATGELTMAGVATRLGVRPSSLYNHVRSRADLVEAMRSAVFASVRGPAREGEGWESGLVGLVRSYRDGFARHPRLIPLLTSHTVTSPTVMSLYADLADVLVRAGVRTGDLLDVVTVLDSFVIGSALDLAAPEVVWDPDHAVGASMRAAIAAAPSGRPRADRSFELGLRMLVDGLRGLTRDDAGPAV